MTTNQGASLEGVSPEDIGGRVVEGGARLPSAGPGYTDQQVLDLINFLERDDENVAGTRKVKARFGASTYEDIAKAYLDERDG